MDAQPTPLEFTLSLWGGNPWIGDVQVERDPMCPGPAAGLAEPVAASAGALADVPREVAANGLPILNSLAGAPTAIYLDFDGDTGQSVDPYDVDGDPSTFNQAEQDTISEAWRQMSVYFAMFDTNVTTQKPTVPMAWDIIGNNTGGATGGWAWVGTFPNTTHNAFNVSSNASSRVTGMAHEVGHVFGLWHQSNYDLLGNKTAEYAGELDPLHGQLMGVDYAGQIHKWSIGHPSNSSNPVSDLQDDIDYIAKKIKTYEKPGGDGYRKDEYGGTIATATALAANQDGQTASGIIERLTDSDAFSFTAEGGSLRIAAVPDSPSGVDLKLAIYEPDGTLLAAKDGDTNDQVITMVLPAGTYYGIVSSHGNYGDVGAYDINVHSLAPGWTSQDIGTTNQAGFAEYDSSTGLFTVAGSGSDIDGTTDHFHFAYQTLTGDGQIVAQVAGLQETNSAAAAGLMIRESVANNARQVTLATTWANGLRMIWRTTTGGTSSEYRPTSSGFSFIWLKLVRKGSLFSAYTSIDGQDYTLWKTATVSMSSKVYIGLAVCSYDQSRLNTATFSDVSLTGTIGGTSPVYNSLPAPENLSVAVATGTGLSLNWDDVAGETGFGVDRSGDGVNFSRVGATAAGVTTYIDSALVGSIRYFYRVSALDATGASVPSNVAYAVNRPSAPTGLTITSPSTSSLVLNWKDTSGESGYRIERSTDGSTFTSRGTVGKNVPSWTDTGLSNSTVYYYRVVPTSSLGDGLATAASNAYTRLPAVVGTAFDSVAYNRIVFRWTDLSVETGYRIERSTDGDTFTTLATVAGNITTHTDTTVQPLKKYYYRVIGLKGTGVGLYPTSIFTATPAAAALPSPWTSKDVGSVGGGGASGLSGGVYTLISSGSDIAGTTDSFRYTYQPLIGDGQIVARVSTIENTDDSAKVGVMIRETLNANARNMMVYLTPSNGAIMQYRKTIGGATSTVTGLTTAATPYYVKLVRAGTTFTGYISATGGTNDWTQVGSTTLSMNTTAYIGLAATSRVNTKLGTSTVDKVAVANKAPTVKTAANSADDPVITTTTALSVLGADDHGEANLHYDWAVTTLPAGAQSPDFSVNATNAAKTTTVTFHQAGVYTFTAMITDSSGQFVTSDVTVTVDQVLSGVTVHPASVELEHNATQQFSAVVADQFTQPMAGNPVATWSVVSGGGQITQDGLFTAPSSSATTVVQATFGSVSGTATVKTTVTMLARPTDLRGTLLAGGQLELRWKDNATNEDGYQVYRDDGVQGSLIATLAADSTSFTDPDPAEGIGIYTVWAFVPGTADYGPSMVLIKGGAGNDTMRVRVDYNDLFFEQNQTFMMGIALSQTSQVLVSAGDGDDVLTVTFLGGDRITPGMLNYDGGGGDDILEIAGMKDTDSLAVDPAQVTFGTSPITYDSATVRLNVYNPGMIDLATLSISGSASVALPPGGATPLRVGTLTLGPAATLDLADNDLFVKVPDAAAIRELVKSGRADGAWTGNGIMSSAAKAAAGPTGLAIGPNDKGDGTFIDYGSGPNATVVKYTWNGDANLDGIVNADDYFLADSGFVSQQGGYGNGDFNYDGVVNSDDYFLIDSAFIGQLGPLSASSGVAGLRLQSGPRLPATEQPFIGLIDTLSLRSPDDPLDSRS
ncbi:MAG: hypothetical protein NTU53_09940 [Planctomycetota bacterium]|nr:hypothetical protein [Planctomycetota bacterium]